MLKKVSKNENCFLKVWDIDFPNVTELKLFVVTVNRVCCNV